MPLGIFQKEIAKILSSNRSEQSFVAGATPLNFEPQSLRYSYDLDIFHDSLKLVTKSFEEDRASLLKSKFKIEVEILQPGYIRAIVSRKGESTKIEWAHDTSFRFLPVLKSSEFGFVLHPIDLAINKVLALVGRNEARDYLDVHECDSRILSLGALVWAACGKDPGFNPNSMLELLRRKGSYRKDDFLGLNLAREINLESLKSRWIEMLNECENLISKLPASEVGCLYYSKSKAKFVTPEPLAKRSSDIVCHFGKPGGRVLSSIST